VREMGLFLSSHCRLASAKSDPSFAITLRHSEGICSTTKRL
jgi:hypothetical protein